ncbi:MAG: HAD-IC family P-type ATPase, partial [Clostridia bacterium]|nr:HAD-IC family P-type ATPase [Clostridia bacterium]
ADAIIINGSCEVNESLLTGESKAVKKKEGDNLLAGSFIYSGTVYARLDKIGKQSYIQSIATEAKKFKSPNSNLLKDINALVKYISVIIVPVAGLMLINNFFAYNKNINIAIAKTCGSITGMVPAGMFLLITMALALGVIKLARKKTLVKELYSIEMLARTNCLCLDKTGTITDGTMQVSEFLKVNESNDISYFEIIPNMLGVQPHNNSTANAMIEYFGRKTTLTVVENLPFSSQRKFFATEFEGLGTYILGAPEFVYKKMDKNLLSLIQERQAKGERVLLLAHTKEKLDGGNKEFAFVKPMAIISIVDHIREDAIETISWFKNNNVEIKIISGDDPVTVSHIAERVGVENADQYISLDGLSLQEVANLATKFTVFGRVSPEQKHALVKALRNSGKVVAMTGDGVNDTLALKEADCSIAMADGSEVARNISDLVLLDSKFSSLPAVVEEGRQVINNIQSSSALYLMKTVFTILLSFITIVTLTAYPFSPKQLLLLELLVIGLPSVILAIQPNTSLIKGEFIPQVLKKAIPKGLLMLFNVCFVLILGRFNILNAEEIASLCTLLLVTVGYINLITLCIPLNGLRTAVLILSGILIVIGATALSSLFGITKVTLPVIICFVSQVAVSLPISFLLKKLESKFKNPKFIEKMCCRIYRNLR